jgi:hypothetical protein
MPRLDPGLVPIATHDFWPDQPWHQSVAGREVDAERTAFLHDEYDLKVRCNGDEPLDPNAGAPLYKVYDAKKPSPWWKPWPYVRVPLPPVMHIDSGNPDAQVFFIDEQARRYYELSAFGPSWPYPWRADSIHVWDLDRPWTEHRGSLTGAGVPLWPFIPTVDELEAGHVGRALAFVSAGLDDFGRSAGYSDEPPVGFARKTDGKCQRHPLRAGEWLRMDPAQAPEPKNRQEQTVVETLIEHGAVVLDKTDYEAGHALRFGGDPRFNVNLSLMARMFVVLAA